MNKGYHPESRDTPKYPSCPESLVTVNPNKTLTRTKGLDSQKRLAPGIKHQEAPSGCPSASSWPPKGRPHTQRSPTPSDTPAAPHPSTASALSRYRTLHPPHTQTHKWASCITKRRAAIGHRHRREAAPQTPDRPRKPAKPRTTCRKQHNPLS